MPFLFSPRFFINLNYPFSDSADRKMAAPQVHSRTTHSSGDVPSTPTKSDGDFVNNKAS